MQFNKKSETLLLIVLAAVQFAHIVDFMIIMPLGPQIMRVFDMSAAQFSILISAYNISAGVMSLVGASFLDRLDRRTSLNIFFAGFTLGTALCAMGWDFWSLFFARAFTGAFGGLINSIILSIIGDVIPQSRRGEAMGKVSAAFSMASIFGVPAGIYLGAHFGWESAFWVLAFVSLLIAVAIFWRVPSLRGHLDTQKKSHWWAAYRDAVTDRNERNALLFNFILILGHFSVIPFISPYMVSNVGFSESDLTYIYLIGGMLTIISSPLIGKLSDKIGKPQMFQIFLLFSLIPILVITNLPKVPLAYALVVTSLFFVGMSGRFIPAQTMMTSAVDPQHRGSFMSLASATQQFSSALAAMMTGQILVKSSTGELQNFRYAGILSVFFSLVALILSKKIKSRS